MALLTGEISNPLNVFDCMICKVMLLDPSCIHNMVRAWALHIGWCSKCRQQTGSVCSCSCSAKIWLNHHARWHNTSWSQGLSVKGMRSNAANCHLVHPARHLQGRLCHLITSLVTTVMSWVDLEALRV